MASKNIHAGPAPDQAILDLGFEDAYELGMVQNNLDVETLIASESKAQYDKIKDLLYDETTNDLTQVKRAFILPMHSVSTDRLKAALKEHKITVTNDYEKGIDAPKKKAEGGVVMLNFGGATMPKNNRKRASNKKNVARGCGVVMRRKETFYA